MHNPDGNFEHASPATSDADDAGSRASSLESSCAAMVEASARATNARVEGGALFRALEDVRLATREVTGIVSALLTSGRPAEELVSRARTARNMAFADCHRVLDGYGPSLSAVRDRLYRELETTLPDGDGAGPGLVWHEVMESHPGWAAASEADRMAVLTLLELECVVLTLAVLRDKCGVRGTDGVDGPVL